MTLRAYAKVNLGLRILNKRPDGYHDIETVFHRINLFDTLRVERSSRLLLTTESDAVPHDETNLCLRAAKLLQEHERSSAGAAIALTKRIPVGAGLGGGSSDAAATLLALRELWKTGTSDTALGNIASSIGSDVPFFLMDRSAYATGRGEILQPADVDLPFWIVVVTPPVSISTAWAYKKADGGGKPAFGLSKFITSITTMSDGSLENDFEPAVFPEHPELLLLKKTLLESGARTALLSGSGSSVFGVFDRDDRARAAASRFSGAYSVSLTEPSFEPDLSRH